MQTITKYNDVARAAERAAIRAALKVHHSVPKAAKALDIATRTVYRHLAADPTIAAGIKLPVRSNRGERMAVRAVEGQRKANAATDAKLDDKRGIGAKRSHKKKKKSAA